MARLPSALDLSGPASLRSGRRYASADTTAIGRGMQSLGSDIQSLGGELKRQAEEEKAKQNAVDIARAEAFKTEGFLNTQNEFDNDPDYSTYQKRVPAKTGEIVKNAANLIRDPEMRERWQIGAQTDSLRVNDSIFDRGTTLRRQTEVVAFDDALETNRRIYVDPATTPEAKAKAKSDIEGAIKTGLATGLLTPEAADSRRKTFIEDAEFSRGKLEVERDPSVISKPIPKSTADRANAAMGFFQSQGWTKEQAAGIVGNLMGESGFNTTARNPGDGVDGSDSIGIGQWNGARARALKAYAGERGLDWHDFGVQLAFVNEELNGSERAAGQALRNAKTIDEATAAFVGYERPAGWSAANPRGAHNYKGRLKFAAQAAGQEVNPDWYQALSPEQRQVIQNQAETRQNQINVENRAAIETATANAPTAILNTGRYDGMLPTADQFMSAYGPQEGAERFNNFLASVQTSEQAYNMRTMSSEEIMAMVNEARPVSSGDDAALETERYRTLAAAAETTIKARNADPSTYTRQTFPNVDQAWQAAAVNGNYQTALSATAAAQRQLGVENMRLLPNDIAESAVTKFKDVDLNEKDRIEGAMGLVFSTPDKEQRQAVFRQLVEAGLPEITEGAVEALARGDTGAARRLFQAAMLDPTKLPGQAPHKPAEIDEAIQEQLMADNQIGDLYYGLSDGSTGNYVRAERDQKLMTNAVNLRIRNGEELEAAVDAVAKDMFGDVQAVVDDNAQILLPRNQDPEPVLAGLNALLPKVRSAMESALTIPGDGRGKEVVGTVTGNYVDNVLAEGYFRNSGDGFVFIDPFVGAAVAGADGMPLMFTAEQALQAAPVAMEREKQRLEAPLTDDSFDAFQKRMQQ